MTASRFELAGLLAVALVSPFERPFPLSLPGGFTLTTAEAVLGGWLLLCVSRWRIGPSWSSPLLRPGLALLALAFVAALAAPDHRAHALRVTARLLTAGLTCVAAARLLTSRQRAYGLIDTLMAVGVVVGVVAVLEAARLPAVLDALRPFRPGLHVVGGQVRASSTLVYPTIASMYLEVVFALGMARLLQPGRAPRAWAIFALTLIGAGVIATFTRAGLITLGLTLAVAASIAWTRTGGIKALLPVGTLAAILLILVRISWAPDLLRTRFATDTSQAWYGARYEVPATVTLGTGSHARVPVVVQNEGLMAWRSDTDVPFALSYHWLEDNGRDVLQYDGLRTPFPVAVAPGARVRVDARVQAPSRPGRYVLVWDVVQEHRTWLSVQGVSPARSVAVVSGAAVGRVMTTPVARLPRAANRVPRLQLWRVALQVALERPLMGVGPDNFRFLYGARLGLAEWDTRVHANSMYLETLVGAGVPALAALLWMLASMAEAISRAWRHVAPAGVPLLTAVTAAWLAMAGHGLVDSFLIFTPTYIVFALAAGLSCSPAVLALEGADADCV